MDFTTLSQTTSSSFKSRVDTVLFHSLIIKYPENAIPVSGLKKYIFNPGHPVWTVVIFTDETCIGTFYISSDGFRNFNISETL